MAGKRQKPPDELVYRRGGRVEPLVPVTPAENLRGSEIVRLVLGDETLPAGSGQLAAEAVAAACRSLDIRLDLARLAAPQIEQSPSRPSLPLQDTPASAPADPPVTTPG